MQKFLKAAAVATAMALVATAAFAADAKAKVTMEGSIFGTDGFHLDNKNQKDADMLEFSVSNERAGAAFKLWANLKNADADNFVGDRQNEDDVSYLTGDDPVVRFRSAVLWFKPIDMVKISVGNVSGGLFTEQLNWWKVPTGADFNSFDRWASRWSSYATVEGPGVSFDLTPVEGLSVSLGYTPGFGTNDLADGYSANTKWGISAKYNIAGFGDVGASFRDEGENEAKLIKVGVQTSSLVPGLTAMLQFVGRMEYNNNINSTATEDAAFNGFSIDNHFAYAVDKFSVKANFPVTIRISGIENDNSFMTYDVKFAYGLGTISPYFRLTQEGLNFGDVAFTPAIKLGAEWGYDGGSFDIGLQIDVPAEGADVTWSLPFLFGVAF